MQKYHEVINLKNLSRKPSKSTICSAEGCRVYVGPNQEYCRKCRERRNLARKGRTVVYFILGVGTEMIKIGYSNDLKARMEALQTGSPVKLMVITYIDGSQVLESVIHEYLDEFRAHGEWFNMTEEVIGLVEIAANKGIMGVLEAIGTKINLDRLTIDAPQLKS